ncbi:MAG: Crp/Fnr family transcriptional regulator [Cyanobacteria bacterium P01_H01_bin.121]
MYSTVDQSSKASRPFLTWQRVIDWANSHYRTRTFIKDERIPVRPGLLYLVYGGGVRLSGLTQLHVAETATTKRSLAAQAADESQQSEQEEAFLGFVGSGEPFEVVVQEPYTLQAYAHVEQTTVAWLYWQDLESWPHFRREVSEAFRYQNQRKLLLLSALGQRRTIDRLLGFLTLVVREYGQPCEQGHKLPWALTHAQIASAIGATRVTVTRLVGSLRQQGLLHITSDHLIVIPDLVEAERLAT